MQPKTRPTSPRLHLHRKPAAAPTIAIIVRTLNRPHLLQRALRSLAEQKRLPDEVILVNDGGASVAEVVDEFRHLTITVIDNADPSGRATAGNQGVAATHADFIGFLDDDDSYLPDHLQRLEKCLLHFDARVAYSGCKLVQRDALGETGEQGILQTDIIGQYNDPFDPQRLWYENYIPLINVLIDRQLWLQIGGFDPAFDIFEDWDMLLRLSQQTRFYHLSRLTTEYAIWGQQQITQNTKQEKWAQAYHQILQKHIMTLPAEQQIAVLTQYWQISQERRGLMRSAQTEVQALQVDLIRQQESVAQAEQKSKQIEQDRTQYENQIQHWQQETQLTRQQIVNLQTQYEQLNTQVQHERRQFELQTQNERQQFKEQMQHERRQFEEQMQRERQQFAQQNMAHKTQAAEQQAEFETLKQQYECLYNQYNELYQRYQQVLQRADSLHNGLHELSRQAVIGVSKETLNRLATKAESAYALATQTGGVIEDYQRLVTWVRDQATQYLTETETLTQQLETVRTNVQQEFETLVAQLQHLLNLLSASRWHKVRRYVPLTQHIQTLAQHLGQRIDLQLTDSVQLEVNPALTAALPKPTDWTLPAPRPLSTVYPTFASIAGSEAEPRFMEMVNTLGTIPFLLDVGEVLSFSTYCPFDEFFRLDILFATRLRINPCQVRVIIRPLGQAEAVRVCYLDAMQLLDNRFYAVEFEPIADSSGQSYHIEIDSPDASAEAGVAIWCHAHKPQLTVSSLPESVVTTAASFWLQQGVLDAPLSARLFSPMPQHIWLVRHLHTGLSPLHLQVYLRRLGRVLEHAETTATVIFSGEVNYDVRSYLKQHGFSLLSDTTFWQWLQSATVQNSSAEWLWCGDIQALPATPDFLTQAQALMRDDTALIVPLEQHSNHVIRAAYASILREGGIQHTPSGQHATHPYHGYQREVHASGSALLSIRHSCLVDIDWQALTAYQTDLYQVTECIWQLRSQGLVSRYQASVCYLNDKPAGGVDENAYQHDSRYFYQRWQHSLQQHLPAFPSHLNSVLNPTQQPTVLMIDATLPMFDEDSGSLRLFTLIRIWTQLGYRITFLPDNLDSNPKYRGALEALGVEVFCGDYGLADALAHRHFDFAFICRVAEGHRYIPFIRLHSTETIILYDTVDIHYVRERRQAEIEQNAKLAIQAEQTRRKELANCLLADCVITVTEDDGRHLQQELPDLPYAVIPNIHEQQPPPQNGFAVRDGLVFIGNYNHQPNEDAVLAFMDEVMPLIQTHLPGVKLYLIGSHLKPSLTALAGDLVEVIGWVDDVAPAFELRRVFVSYLRYGAGMKGKLGQALSLGLPVVTTRIGAEGMGLTDGETALIADEPEAFAEAVCRLYQTQMLWENLSTQGREYIEQSYGATAVQTRLLSVLQQFSLTEPPKPFVLPPCPSAEHWRPALVLLDQADDAISPTLPQGDHAIAITADTRLRCWITPTSDTIHALRLRIGTYGRVNPCHLDIQLGRVCQRIAMTEAVDNAWLHYRLPQPVAVTAGEPLAIELSCAEAEADAHIAIWCAAQPPRFVTRLHYHPLMLPVHETPPTVSIVIPVFNKALYTYNCLLTVLAYDTAINREVIVIDNASSDETATLLAQAQGNMRVIHNNDNKGFVEACRQGAAAAQGEFIVFLNNDTQVTPNWLHALLKLIMTDERVGAVGSKLVYPSGELQEAGGIIFHDASGWNYGRMQDPTDPRFNQARPVDYCSGASLLIRKSLWETIGGFDMRYAPAYYEDTDLCFAVREAGYQVMYCPDSVVIHHEGITAGTDINSGYKAYQGINQQKFRDKWATTLTQQLAPPPQVSPEAAAWRWAEHNSFPTPAGKIRATHFFAQGSPIDCWSYLNLRHTPAALAQIKAMDFNTVILVIPWVGFQPTVQPMSFNEEYFSVLEALLAQIAAAELQVILRLGFGFDHGIASEPSMRERSLRFATEVSLRTAWIAFLSRVWDSVYKLPHVLGGFISWEDFQLFPHAAGSVSLSERLYYAEVTGYQAYLTAHHSLAEINALYEAEFNEYQQVPIPAHHTAAQKLYLTFCDHVLQQIFQQGRTAFPPLTIEVRVDCDALETAEQRFCHYAMFDIEDNTHVTVLYYSPAWSALNAGDQVSAKAALERLQQLLDTAHQHTQNTLFFDQFNFIDNTPGFEQSTALAADALSDFLHYAAKMLQHHTMGYSLWTMQDKPMNFLRNGLFERHYPSWLMTHGEIVFDEASQQHAVRLAPHGCLTQQIVATEDELVVWPDKSFTLRLQAQSPAEAVQLTFKLQHADATQAHWQETVTQTLPADTWQPLCLTQVEFVMGDTLVIENQSEQAVLLTGFYLYQFCQESGVLDLNGEPKPFYEAFMRFQAAMR